MAISGPAPIRDLMSENTMEADIMNIVQRSLERGAKSDLMLT